jgi:hypothetical protein
VGMFLNAGAVLAYFDRKFPTINGEMYRENQGFAWLFSTFPPWWFVTAFISGFYEQGWMNPLGSNPHKENQ